MPTAFLRSAAARALVAAAALLLGAAQARAGVSRAVVATGAGARVTVSWTASPGGIVSAMLVRETLPVGATASVSSVGASGSTLASVRREGSVWAFLVPRASVLKAGSFSYEVSYAPEAPLPVSGVWRGMKPGSASASGAVGGAASLPGRIPADGGGSGSGVVPGAFAIRAFSVEPSGGATRASFAWTGSGEAAVEIQWAASLAPAGAPTGAKDAAAPASGWKTLATVVPGRTAGLSVTSERAAAGESAGGRDGAAEAVYRYSVETEAPAGFFRLVVPDGADK